MDKVEVNRLQENITTGLKFLPNVLSLEKDNDSLGVAFVSQSSQSQNISNISQIQNFSEKLLSERVLYKEEGAYESFMERNINVGQFADSVLKQYLINPHSVYLINLTVSLLNFVRRLSPGTFCDAFDKIV